MFIGEPQMTQDGNSPDELSDGEGLSGVYTKSLTVHMSEGQYERLRRFAFERRVGYQEIIERALRAYLTQ
jgi:hypothetical protein